MTDNCIAANLKKNSFENKQNIAVKYASLKMKSFRVHYFVKKLKK